jgi:hypothetical protein
MEGGVVRLRVLPVLELLFPLHCDLVVMLVVRYYY